MERRKKREELEKENKILRDRLAQAEREKESLAEQILQVRAEWEAAFNAITDRVFVEDADYGVLRANAAVLRDFGMNPENLREAG